MIGDRLDREVHQHVRARRAVIAQAHGGAGVPSRRAGVGHDAVRLPHDQALGVIHQVLPDTRQVDHHVDAGVPQDA